MDLNLAKNKAATLFYIALESYIAVPHAIHYPLCLYH